LLANIRLFASWIEVASLFPIAISGILSGKKYREMEDNKQTDKNEASGAPEPEVLRAQDDTPVAPKPTDAKKSDAAVKRPRSGTYRPSHKATFIGLAVVAAVLAINGGVIAWLMNAQQNAAAEQAKDSVTLSAETLDGLGVSRNPVGDLGTELTIGPKTTFNSDVTIGSGLSVGGELQLKGEFSANNASFATLRAGNTSLGQLNVNSDITATSLNLRERLAVAGQTQLQGPVTVGQLLTVNNNLNVSGNVAVGGVLSARSFQANSLVSGSTLTIGGHIITRGSAPAVGRGGAVGSNGTVSISGNDASGTVAVNTGIGAGNGLLALISFRSQYGNIPHVVVTPVGRHVDVYVTRSIGGFSIYADGAMSPGGYAFDYIIMQ
jgi:hypothetical protein